MEEFNTSQPGSENTENRMRNFEGENQTPLTLTSNAYNEIPADYNSMWNELSRATTTVLTTSNVSTTTVHTTMYQQHQFSQQQMYRPQQQMMQQACKQNSPRRMSRYM